MLSLFLSDYSNYDDYNDYDDCNDYDDYLIFTIIQVVKTIKAVKAAKTEYSVEMLDTEISRWQAFDAGKPPGRHPPNNYNEF